MDPSVRITVVIPCRETEGADVTLNSLALQTYQNFKIVIVKDQGKGACWARNEGFKQVDTEFVLFSDNDIQWKSHAFESLVNALDRTKAHFSYGRYLIGQDIWSHSHWDPVALKKFNYISTMSLVRTKDLPERPFDENLGRLQDWDLWLTLAEQGKRGVYCDDLIFTTDIRSGITYDKNLNPYSTFIDAERVVKKKHGIDYPISQHELSKKK